MGDRESRDRAAGATATHKSATGNGATGNGATPPRRRRAVDEVAPQRRIDELLTVTRPRLWLALTGLIVIVVSLGVWSGFGRIPVTVDGIGVMMRGEGLIQVRTPVAGQVVEVSVGPGDSVQAGATLAMIRKASGELHPITSQFPGRVIAVDKWQHQPLMPGDTVVTMESDQEDLDVILFLPVGLGTEVKPGMQVHIALSYVSKDAYGYLLGTVEDVSAFPVTRERLAAELGSESMADEVLATGMAYRARVDLIEDPSTPSGYKWSIGQGPDIQLASGKLVRASVIVGRQSPLHFVIPAGQG